MDHLLCAFCAVEQLLEDDKRYFSHLEHFEKDNFRKLKLQGVVGGLDEAIDLVHNFLDRYQTIVCDYKGLGASNA